MAVYKTHIDTALFVDTGLGLRIQTHRKGHEGDMIRMFIPVFPAVLAVYLPFCTPELRPTQAPELVQIEELWERPDELAERDLFNGPWGIRNAPAADEVYTFIRFKTGGPNPGMTVTDPRGREWRVKQAPRDGRGHEGPIEVVLSRVLSGVGYHQPPVYFLPEFRLQDGSGTRIEPWGRFRLELESLKDGGSWSWQQNPFVGMKPYQGLLVILLLFNSSDLKNSDNTLYELSTEFGPKRWFVGTGHRDRPRQHRPPRAPAWRY